MNAQGSSVPREQEGRHISLAHVLLLPVGDAKDMLWDGRLSAYVLDAEG